MNELMGEEDFHDFDDVTAKNADIDQTIRINELREAASEASGGEMLHWESPDLPADVAEDFWTNVVAYDSAPMSSHFEQLEKLGYVLPAPEALGDAELTEKLWELFEGLAKTSTYLSSTDHLSDRELYALLWHDLLREHTPEFPPGSGWNCHLDILGGCSEEDMELHMRFYADESERQQSREQWPDDVIPPHEDPPYDRDRLLPKPPDYRHELSDE